MAVAEAEQIRAAVKEVLSLVVQRGEPMSPEMKQQLAMVLGTAAQRLEELQQVQEPQEQSVPKSAELLWILSGGDPEAFTQYLQNIGDPSMQALASNESQLLRTIETLQRTDPQSRDLVEDGVPQAPLQSSNIWGFQYDPKSGKLRVRFQGGNVYQYEGVPPQIFNIFRVGAVAARTKGKNQYGRWWKGKVPSLGAAFYQLIRMGGYPYEKLK